VRHLGRERVIGCWEVDGVLVDPGPESTVETLLEGLGEGFEPRAILLTHIHFDHAGASGALVRRWPRLPVYVHEKGAPHLADPERLVRSATRLYGEADMKRLWGEVMPVPGPNLRVLTGGERVLSDFKVAYTPGHASHHVAYLHRPTATAFCGDVAGARIPPSDLVLAPTPPPDVDVEAWHRSIDLLLSWKPDRLAYSHFGDATDVERHLQALRDDLDAAAERVQETDMEGFIAGHRERIFGLVDAETAEAYLQAVPSDHIFLGLDRWRTRRRSAGEAGRGGERERDQA
jgi:glyoxylase-like metal-dependent hydrolase (beta-lactamase superfamily II)